VIQSLDQTGAEHHDTWFAMRLSLAFGVLMLAGKTLAYFLTGSSAILADATESVVHVVAVGFAAFSLRLSGKPPAPTFLYGYEKISFFSAGFGGAMIVLAAVTIIVTSIREWLAGLRLENLGAGALLILGAGVVNAALGWYLVKTGHRAHSIILEANGKHVLTDSLTSFGVLIGLVLVLETRWKPFDPIVAIAVALNILWSGEHLIWRSIQGLLDYSDPKVGAEIRERMDAISGELGVKYHGLRFRTTGYRQLIVCHVLFPQNTLLRDAHRLATSVEERLPKQLSFPAEVITHLEPLEDHEQVHSLPHYTGVPKPKKEP
jgi:cation diffusion facilitator family transporter